MFILPPVLYRGSVKNVRGEVHAETLVFEYSDRYSVFDWGEMPDQLTDKGKALSIMGKSFFRYLENPKNWTELFNDPKIQETFNQDYLKKLSTSDLYKKYCANGLNHHAVLSDESYPWNSPFLKVKNISIIQPTINSDDQSYDYYQYQDKPVNCLVPLEVIFRMGLARGNSLSKRLGASEADWKKFGFDKIPSEGSMLSTPVIDFSTKLERGDRYLEYTEAKKIAGLSENEWDELHQMTHLIALNLFSFHQKLNLELWDGKIEVAFIQNADGSRSFMLVDSVGIDELRLLYKGKSFSKEFLRETYKGSPWYENLENAKKESLLSGADFKDVCIRHYKSSPEPLEPKVLERAIAVYKSYCNEVAMAIGKPIPFEEKYTLENYSENYL